jgi:hypothetical protein
VGSDQKALSLNFYEADFGSRNKIIDLYDQNWKYRQVCPDTSRFTMFFDTVMDNGYGTHAICDTVSMQYVTMFTNFYVAYEQSSIARLGNFLGFCAIQERVHINLYHPYKAAPFEFEIPWFLVAKNADWCIADIADAMLEALLAEEAQPPHVKAVWAYDFGTRPQGEWWPACLRRAGFSLTEETFTRCEPDSTDEYIVRAFKINTDRS